MRDTDADWQMIGTTEPFWGVITAPEFKRENLDSDRLKHFYNSGIEQVALVAARFERMSGTPLHVARALEFGCGTGRLSEAMTKYADNVFGFDVSSNMLVEARRHSKGGVTYCDKLPDCAFGWINSFIVFQHIPPERGHKILDELLNKLERGGFISLHFTLYHDFAALQRKIFGKFSAFIPRMWAPVETGLDKALRQIRRASTPRGTMFMYNYHLNRICASCHKAGIEELTLVHTEHGGYHGVEIYGRASP